MQVIPMGTAARPGHVVGIGASAGGLEAIGTFFDHMPESTGLAFVVVQHLSPDYKSLMQELLSKHTSMPVLRIEDGMAVHADHVYLIPPKKNLRMFHGKLLLDDQEAGRGLNLPIDIFLRSLAADQGEKAIGVILSGTGSDGTRGLRAIKEAGGMAMVQTRESAKFDGMPRAALDSGLADFELAPEEMPAQLLAYVKHPYATMTQEPTPLLQNQGGLTRIFALLRERSKVDFTYYKPSTIIRRIERRMTVNQVRELPEYVDVLEHYPAEVGLLFRELLIGVTNFFRDAEAFTLLEREYLPALFEGKENRELRFWVAGCSTGEEAYSLAMVARECMERMGRQLDLKVFATDVDRDAIVTAGGAVYPDSVAADLPEGYLAKYFHRADDRLRVARTIREMVVFAQHDLIRDPPFTHIDLVSCRNLLIYLQPVLQEKVLGLFNFSLVPEGLLFLGSSETTGELAEYFESLHHKHKIYRSRGRSRPLGEQVFGSSRAGRQRVVRPRFGVGGELVRAGHDSWALERFLQVLSPEVLDVALVVNDRKEVVHVIGESSGFFQLPRGRMHNDVTKMAVTELGIALATGLQRVLDSKQPLTYSNVHLHKLSPPVTLNLRFRPLPARAGQEPLVAILVDRVKEKAAGDAGDESYDLSREAEQRIADLEQELQFNKENLQATIEELETANEELQATNEELLASNEELQSTNEELQSVNEELHTVNAEYHRKIVELTELNNDMENLLAATRIGTLFVDEEYELRKFSSGLESVIRINDSDLGQPLDRLRHTLEGVDLRAVAEGVQRTASPLELEASVAGGDGHVLLRCIPYEIGPETYAGVVMTFVDMSERHRAEVELRRSEGRYRDLFRSLAAAFAVHRIILDEEGTPVDYEFREVNEAFERTLGLERQAVVGRRVTEVLPGIQESEVGWIERYGRVALTGESQQFEVFEPHLKRWFSVIAYRPEPEHFVTLFTDITERMSRNQSLLESRRQLEAQRRLAEAFLMAGEDALYSELLAVLLDITDSPIGYMGYINGDGDLVSPSLTRDVWDRCEVADKSILFARESWSGLWGRSLLEQATLWANEPLAPPEGHLALHCALAVPILGDGELIGQLVVGNRTGGYDSGLARTVEQLAAYIAPFLRQHLLERGEASP